jgi:abortive infection bacteriophage resistance protein
VFSVANKGFKTLDEQIAILDSRGLKIPDKSAAKEFLLRNNYYRVSGYSLTLRDHDVFFESATFQNIIDIYECDHEMRHILLNPATGTNALCVKTRKILQRTSLALLPRRPRHRPVRFAAT